MSEKNKKRLLHASLLIFTLLLLSITFIYAFERRFDVSNATPTGVQNNQPARIMIRFSRPIVELGGLERHSGLKLSKYIKITPPLKGRLNFTGTDALSFIIDKKSLKPNTKYTVEVKPNITSVKGKKLGYTYKFSFINDCFRVVGANIRQNATHQTRRPYIYFYFSQPIDRDSAKKHIKVWQNSTTIPYELKRLSSKKIRYRYLSARYVSWRAYYRYIYRPHSRKFLYQLKMPTLKKNSSYIITISKRLRSTRGNLSLLNTTHLRFKTFPPLFLVYPLPYKELKNPRPHGSIFLRFSNGIKTSKKKLNEHIQILNKKGKQVKGGYLSHYRNSRYIYCYFKLLPRQEYTLVIKKGIKDIFGQKLSSDIKLAFETSDYQPIVKIPYPYSAVVENYGKISDIPISFINLNWLNVSVKAFHSPYALANERPSRREKISLKKRIQRRNIRFLKKIKLKKFLNKGSGILKIAVRAEKNTRSRWSKYYTGNFFLQFTKMAITMKYSPKNIFLYVTDLKSTHPIPYATIEIFKKHRTQYSKRLFSGRTDRRGVLIISENSRIFKQLYYKYIYSKKLVVFARKGRDFCMLDNSYHNKVSLYNTAAGYPGTTMQKFYASIFTPKGIYKKNETVVIKGYVRENRGGTLRIQPGKRYKLTCNDPTGKEIIHKTIRLNRFGSFATSYKIPADPSLGRYTISLNEVNGGSTQSYDSSTVYGSFMIEAYRPRDFEVSVKSGIPGKALINGDKLPFSVLGQYMYGGLMANNQLKYKIEAFAHYFYPSRRILKKFSFSANNWLASPSDKRVLSKANRTTITYQKTGYLNKQGRFNHKIKTDVPFYTSARYVISAEIRDKKRQSVVASSATVVHKGDYYIGYKFKNYFISTKEPLELSLVSATPKEHSAGTVPVNVRVYRVAWNNVRKLAADGTYRWSSERSYKLVKNINTSTSGSYRSIRKLRLPLKKAGSYIITMRSKDKNGNKITNLGYCWVWGSEYVPWQMNDDQVVDLITDKKEYTPGSYAKIMVKSPYKKIDALVTVEREGVMHSFRRTLRGTADIIKVPIKKGYAPNVFVSVILLQGRIGEKFPTDKLKDIYKPTIKVGYAVLNVKTDHKKLRVRIRSNKTLFMPRQTVNLNLKVTDKYGRGVKSELSVFAVDEAVLSLIGYPTPNPFNAFFGRRRLLIRSFDNRLRVLGQHRYKLKGENPGGDKGYMKKGRSSQGMSNISIRQIFKAIAYSKTSVITSYRGIANVRFKLPDNLTKYRIMVIAADRKDRFGSASKHIRVSKPLILKPALPRFANLDDSIKAGVVVDNNSKQAGRVTISVKNWGIARIGKAVKSVFLKPGESKEVRFNFKAKKVGTAHFTFRASLRGGGKTHYDSILWKIPINMPTMTVAVAKSAILRRGTRNERVWTPKNAYPNSAGLEFIAASTALINLRGSVEYLFGYPYGCLEQKMSRVMPMLLAGDLVKAFKLKVKVNYRKLVQSYINELKQYQDRSSGGFYLWPERTYQYRPSPYLSSYMLYLLWMAKQKGYSVSNDMLKKAVRFVKYYLAKRNFRKSAYPYASGYWISTDTLALYVLSQLGQADESYIDYLNDEMSGQPLYIKSLMVQTMHKVNRNKYKTKYRWLMRDIFRKLKYEGSYAYIQESGGNYSWYRYMYLSDTKTTAAVLNMLLTVNRRNTLIPKLVRGIMKSIKNGRWRTTQENMYVFWALSRYFKIFEKTRPNYVFNFSSGKKNLFTGAFRRRTLKVLKKFRPFSFFPAQKASHNIKLRKAGPGLLYYTLRLKYAPKKPLPPQSRGFTVSKQFFNHNGTEEIKDGRFKAGKVYKVVLNIHATANRHNVVVDDPLPAGLEAINPRLKRSTLAVNVNRYTGTRSGTWWWYGFNRVAMKDDRVCLFANQLKEGRYTYTYFVKAVTSGDFMLFPTKAEEMYYPEIFGTSQGKRIVVE